MGITKCCQVLVLLSFFYFSSIVWVSITEKYHLLSVRPTFEKVIFPPGIIIRRIGGIGNQLFRFACSYALAKRTGWPLYFHAGDVPEDRKFWSYERSFALDQLNIPNMTLINDKTTVNGAVFRVNESDIFHKPKTNRTTIFLEISDYCHVQQPWSAYAEDIKTMLKPSSAIISSMSEKVTLVLQLIRTTESVAVHVRLGDVAVTRKQLVPTIFHRCAIRQMAKMIKQSVSNKGTSKSTNSPNFFVFSDDIKTAKEELLNVSVIFNITFVSSFKTSSMEDFYMMTQCKHFILPISTFSWWAAYLSDNVNKTVISVIDQYYYWKTKRGHTQQTPIATPFNWVVLTNFSKTC